MSDLKPMDPLERLTAYHSGQVLPEVAARLDETRKATETTAKEPVYEMDELERPLYPRERKELDELVKMPGWRVVQRLLKKAHDLHRTCAIADSQNQPLQRAAEISQAWALIAIYSRVQVDLYASIEVELQAYKAEKEQKR